MPIFDAVDLNTKALHGNVYGNAVSYGGRVAIPIAPVTADKIRLCSVPAGVKVNTVILTNTDLGTTVPASIQFEPKDGSAAIPYATGVALETAAPNGTRFSPEPVTLQKDCNLVLLLGTVSAGAAGSVNAVVDGELVGVN